MATPWSCKSQLEELSWGESRRVRGRAQQASRKVGGRWPLSQREIGGGHVHNDGDGAERRDERGLRERVGHEVAQLPTDHEKRAEPPERDEQVAAPALVPIVCNLRQKGKWLATLRDCAQVDARAVQLMV